MEIDQEAFLEEKDHNTVEAAPATPASARKEPAVRTFVRQKLAELEAQKQAELENPQAKRGPGRLGSYLAAQLESRGKWVQEI